MKKNNYDYPAVSDRLIKCLERDFPGKLPDKYVDSYNLGFLIGQQSIITKLKNEKNYNENGGEYV